MTKNREDGRRKRKEGKTKRRKSLRGFYLSKKDPKG